MYIYIYIFIFKYIKMMICFAAKFYTCSDVPPTHTQIYTYIYIYYLYIIYYILYIIYYIVYYILYIYVFIYIYTHVCVPASRAATVKKERWAPSVRRRRASLWLWQMSWFQRLLMKDARTFCR